MFRSIVLTAALAGIIAGAVVSLAQRVEVIPLIQLAETYEDAAALAQQHAQMHGPAGTYAADTTMPMAEWEPAPGLERTVYTVIANMVTSVGFALVLVAGFAIAGGRLDWRRGLLWGLGGFTAFALAPSLGLPAAPPGSAEADLVLRQLWWTGTVACTLLGLALIVFAARLPHKLAGLIVIALPHVIGAPVAGGTAAVPPELARDFALASLATALVFWMVLGGLAGHLFRRFAA
jgi:cobalt transporter subunit CbtA